MIPCRACSSKDGLTPDSVELHGRLPNGDAVSLSSIYSLDVVLHCGTCGVRVKLTIGPDSPSDALKGRLNCQETVVDVLNPGQLTLAPVIT